jgi:predicted metalloprotease with PDZ domain
MHDTRYRIAVQDAHAHLFEIRCTLGDPAAAGQRFRLPAWIPGSYLIREFARQFIDVRAEAAGQPIAICKEAKDVWRVAPTTRELTVTAVVYAYDLSVRTAYLDSTRAYFNGPAVFLCPEGREAAPCTLEIVRPDGDAYARWRVATTLAAESASPYGFGRYRAASYDELIDHPVEMADFALATFDARGARHEIALTGRAPTDLDRVARDLARVCTTHIDLFGGKPPFDRYLFQVIAVGDGHGGLEHRTSTSLLCRRDELPRPRHVGLTDEYVNFLGLASHEYFHAWNVKRIKPQAFAPYDLARENYTRELWAYEGITSYYDDLALVRSGVIDAQRYLELLGRTITTVLRTPGRRLQSLADASFDAWIKFYRPDENSPNATVSYYAKGALVALALDLTLRIGGDGSLDDVMRTLWGRFGARGQGVPEGEIERIAVDAGGAQVRELFARCVHGTDDPSLDALLAAFGVEYHLRATSGANDRGGKPASGPAPRASLEARIGADMRIQHVYRGGPAERAGLAANDMLVALDDLRATPDALAALGTRRNAGDRVRVHAFRRDELFEAELTLLAPPLDACYLTLQAQPAPCARALRDVWLGTA